MEKITEILDKLDLAKFVPELDKLLELALKATRFAVRVGPMCILLLGLIYLFLHPNEANHKAGYRTFFGMGSLHAWRFTQRVSGFIMIREVCPMKCPFCGDQESKVVDSRLSEDGLSIRRRRECLNCQRRFTTYEIVESLPIIVVKRDGSRQSFDRNKILNSMVRAFDKRQVEMSELDRITTEIEQAVQNTLEREVTTDKLGEMVLERIKPLDEVAYIRFASVYRRFQDVQSFINEIKTMK